MKLKLEITLDNDAMQTAWEVTDAIVRSIGRSTYTNEVLNPSINGFIHDENGNKVGEWNVIEED